jgi:hypothetical protein
VSFTAAALPLIECARLRFSPITHLIVDFDEAAFARDGRKQKAASPYGLSGGPVWRLGDIEQFDRGTNREKLVGIAVECRRNALIAVRLSLLFEIVRSAFPAADPMLPRSRYFPAKPNLTS